MPAPVGNKFWENRSKHGRDILFATPELLWEAATEYFEWCTSNPLIEIDFKGKDASKVEIPHMRPFTIHGLCLYIGCGTSYLRNFQPPNEDFKAVITRIEEMIYSQKFDGAAAGFLNPNIIASDLGLAKKIEQKDTTEKGTDFDNLSQDELKELAKMLEKINEH